MSETVHIHGLSVKGEGIGRLPDGRVVFIEGALPGDTVEANLTETRKKVQYAELVGVTTPSPDRVTPVCTVPRCGGCPIRGVSSALQGQLKRQAVIDAMRRIAGIDVSDRVLPIHQFGDGWGYRHRVRLHANWSGDGWMLGYHERRSRKLVPLVTCPVIWPELLQLGLSLQRALRNIPQEAQLTEVELAYSRRDGRGGAKIFTQGPMGPWRKTLAWVDEAGLMAVEVEAADSRWRHGNLELRYDHARADDFDLRFEPGLFTQAFPEANDALASAVLAAVRPRETPRILELHAGIGNFSVPLARAGAQVTAYERQKRAAILGQRNLSGPGLQARMHAEDDTAALAIVQDFDVVLMDPPRTGARAVVEVLAQKGPPKVVYVSCDPATLARDTSLLLAGRYKLASLETFDMFPQTPHVESLATFELA
jgi:23S rRNA (uracil1939-C5)-methyltransferase